MGQLEATITVRCDRVRENRGDIVEVLFQSHAGNGHRRQDEILLCNFMRDRGVPEPGQEYEITIKPVATKRVSER